MTLKRILETYTYNGRTFITDVRSKGEGRGGGGSPNKQGGGGRTRSECPFCRIGYTILTIKSFIRDKISKRPKRKICSSQILRFGRFAYIFPFICYTIASMDGGGGILQNERSYKVRQGGGKKKSNFL